MSREKARPGRWEPTEVGGTYRGRERERERKKVAATRQSTTSTRPFCRVEGRGTQPGGSGGSGGRNSKTQIPACATAAARVTLQQQRMGGGDGGGSGSDVGTTLMTASTLAPAAISRSTTSKWPFIEATKTDVAPSCDARRAKRRGDGHEPHTGSTRMCARDTGGAEKEGLSWTARSVRANVP